MNFGRAIQWYRNARGLSLQDLADASGISKDNLYRIENGNGNPTLDTMEKVATALSVPLLILNYVALDPDEQALIDGGIQQRLSHVALELLKNPDYKREDL